MRYVFVVNPVAGKGEGEKLIRSMVDYYFSIHDGDVQIYVTERHNHAKEIAQMEAQKGEPVRIFACGGDGTLNEVADGVYSYENVEISAIPCGTGNDFLKMFHHNINVFTNIEALINGSSKTIDLIRCNNQYSINIASMGMDAEIAANMARFKKLPVLGGKTAYTTALFYCLFKKTKNKFQIIFEDGKKIEGNFLFALAANGKWYGGGYKGAPDAILDDGLLDLVLIKSVSIIKLLTLINTYKRGEHHKLKKIGIFLKAKRMEVISEHPAALNRDGEITMVNRAVFEIVPSAIRFICPAVF